MGNIIVGLILLAIFGGAIAKIAIDKKNGVKCSGCPSCPSNVKKDASDCTCQIEV